MDDGEMKTITAPPAVVVDCTFAGVQQLEGPGIAGRWLGAVVSLLLELRAFAGSQFSPRFGDRLGEDYFPLFGLLGHGHPTVAGDHPTIETNMDSRW
jgi:hypothetical protein